MKKTLNIGHYIIYTMFVLGRNMFWFQLSLLCCIFVLFPLISLKFFFPKLPSDFFPSCEIINVMRHFDKKCEMRATDSERKINSDWSKWQMKYWLYFNTAFPVACTFFTLLSAGKEVVKNSAKYCVKRTDETDIRIQFYSNL